MKKNIIFLAIVSTCCINASIAKTSPQDKTLEKSFSKVVTITTDKSGKKTTKIERNTINPYKHLKSPTKDQLNKFKKDKVIFNIHQTSVRACFAACKGHLHSKMKITHYVTAKGYFTLGMNPIMRECFNQCICHNKFLSSNKRYVKQKKLDVYCSKLNLHTDYQSAKNKLSKTKMNNSDKTVTVKGSNKKK